MQHTGHKKKINDKNTHLCDCQTVLYLRMLDRMIDKEIFSPRQDTRTCKTIDNRIRFSVKLMQGYMLNGVSRCVVKTVEEFPYYEMVNGWRQIQIDGLRWLPERCPTEFRFSLPKDMKMMDATDSFYKALYSVTNFYNTRLYSNLLQFRDVDDFESQFFCYSTSVSDQPLEEYLKKIKARHLCLEDGDDLSVEGDCISLAVIVSPPDYSKKDLDEFLKETPLNIDTIPLLPTNWSEVKDRAYQLLREKLNYYSSSFINKHFDLIDEEQYQEMFLLAVEKIPLEQGWFILHNMDRFDLTSARQYQNMWFVDHVERNWVALFRAAQIYEGQCRLCEKELLRLEERDKNIIKTTKPSPKKKKGNRKTKHYVEEELGFMNGGECLQCFSRMSTVYLEPCGHCYLCSKCWKNYCVRYFPWTDTRPAYGFHCFVCRQSVTCVKNKINAK